MYKGNLKCPHEESGVCHRRGCIYIPRMDCLTEREYKHRLKIAKKMKKKGNKYHERKRIKDF